MAPLYTVLLCVPAVLALFIAVGGLVLLRSRRQGAHRPTQASERRTWWKEARPPRRRLCQASRPRNERGERCAFGRRASACW